MDGGVQLRDEATRDRIRAAVEFLDPSKCNVEELHPHLSIANIGFTR